MTPPVEGFAMIRELKEQRERRCPTCGQGTLVARVIRDEFEYGPEDDRITIVAEGVPVLECSACGETLYGPEAARVRHQAICRTLGLLTPEQIKGVREKLGKKQAEFAELTGIGVATLSRWEQGRLIQTRALDRYLRLLQWEENVQRLRNLEAGPNGMNEHVVAAFVKRAGELLAGHLDDLGLLVYSSADSLKESPVVFWGFNPGGASDVTDPSSLTIAQALELFPRQHESFITQQEWPNPALGTVPEEEPGIGIRRNRRYKAFFPAGKAPYQKAVKAVLESVGSPDALVTNFIFFQSQRQEHLRELDRKIDLSWPVHLLLFDIARPRLLITTSTVANHLRRRSLMLFSSPTGSIKSGWANWKCVLSERVQVPSCPAINDLAVLVIPHPSYWGRVIDSKAEAALRWVKEKVKQAPRS
jgi:putative zinc finger/helix-turn-helix YgiT family protein